MILIIGIDCITISTGIIKVSERGGVFLDYQLSVYMLGVAWILSTLGVVAGVNDLYLLGLFPLEGAWRGGAGQVVAVDMALAEVNAREDILPGYKLNLIWNNTKVGLLFFTF